MQEIIRKAEEIIAQLPVDNYGVPLLTMTKLRKFLTAVNSINNKVLAYQSQSGEGKDLRVLPVDLANEIRYLEVKLLYQCGRDRDGKSIRDFADKAKLFERIREVGNDPKKFSEFAKFMEALVAFYKFKGGKMNG